MEELLRIEEVAERLRVDPATVRRWVKNGTLEAVKLPTNGHRHSYRVKKSVFDALVEPKLAGK